MKKLFAFSLTFWKETMKLPIFTTTTALFISLSAHAAIIDLGIITRDSSTGLDWLDLTVTQNQDYNTVFSRTQSGGDLEGWAFATGEQFEGLIGSFGGSPSPQCPANNNTNYCSWETEHNGIVNQVLEFLGDLSNGDLRSHFLLADILSNDKHFGALLSDPPSLNNETTITKDYISTHNYVWDADEALPTLGSALIRTSIVPVPAAAWLFLSATTVLFGLRWRLSA